jgi:nucleoside-diphosphate-sugar epimerase
MKRVAILGANGQVGAEVCLRLRHAEDLEVVPVVRNLSGSAFLRLNGMECRHGRIADLADARRLIGDCDAVVSFALSTTAIPRVDREINARILRGIVEAAKPGVPIVLASTIMVYAPGLKLRVPDSYGLEKLAAERLLSRLSRRSHHPLFVFRLGHVLGELQNITRKICTEIREGNVALPHQGQRASNTVFTAAIVEAVAQVTRGTANPGTYDLITSPQWTWLNVYESYAAQLGLALSLAPAELVRDQRLSSRSTGSPLRRMLRYLAAHHALTERLTYVLAFLPHSVNQQMYLRYLQTRAVTEIGALKQRASIEPCVEDWRELQVRAFGHLPDPLTLMSRYPLECTLGSSEAGPGHDLASYLPQ